MQITNKSTLQWTYFQTFPRYAMNPKRESKHLFKLPFGGHGIPWKRLKIGPQFKHTQLMKQKWKNRTDNNQGTGAALSSF